MGVIEILELLFSNGAIRISPLKAIVFALISRCNPKLVPKAINIITIPSAMAAIAIFIIRPETVLSLVEDERMRWAIKNSKFKECFL
jgi:hypothetical protein